jgi:hypothetical protein
MKNRIERMMPNGITGLERAKEIKYLDFKHTSYEIVQRMAESLLVVS